MDPEGWRLLEGMRQALERVMPGDATLAAARLQGNCAAETSGRGSESRSSQSRLRLRRSSYCAEGECGIQGQTLAPHDDRDGSGRDRRVKKRYGSVRSSLDGDFQCLFVVLFRLSASPLRRSCLASCLAGNLRPKTYATFAAENTRTPRRQAL